MLTLLHLALAALTLLVSVYGARRSHRAVQLGEATRADVGAVLGSLGHVHGSLEILALLIRRRPAPPPSDVILERVAPEESTIAVRKGGG